VTTILEGDEAVDALSGALAEVTGLISYLGARIDPPDGDWFPCRELVDDPDLLARVIRSTEPGLGTDDPVVAASVFVQGYSYRVLSLAVACFTASGLVPDSSAPRMAVGLSGPWPSRVAYLSPRLLVSRAGAVHVTDALRWVVDTAIGAHLAPLVDGVRAGLGVPIGRRLLWGNIAASAATAFRTMEGRLGSFVQPLGHAFFDMAPPEFQGLGSFYLLENAGSRGWFWERTNCCLIDRLPGGVRCADCSLTSPELRRRAYRDSLDQAL
jgi:iron complex transport system ATP-binding protein